MADLTDSPEPMDLANLLVTWAAVKRLQEEFDRVSATKTGPALSPRLMDEAQTVGPRTYITAHRCLQIAWDNHQALIALLQHHGATHWAPWKLMRPIVEASFYVVWILDPDEGRLRRQRGLRAELLDAREHADDRVETARIPSWRLSQLLSLVGDQILADQSPIDPGEP